MGNPRTTVVTYIYTHLHILSVFRMYTSYGYTVHITHVQICRPHELRPSSHPHPFSPSKSPPTPDPGPWIRRASLDPKMGPILGVVYRHIFAHVLNVRIYSYNIYAESDAPSVGPKMYHFGGDILVLLNVFLVKHVL